MLSPDITLKHHEDNVGKEFAKHLVEYRIILFLAFTFSFLLRYLFLKNDINFYDPLLIRAAFSGLLLMSLVFSFFRFFYTKIQYLVYPILVVYTVYALLLIYKNNFTVSYTLELILLSSLFCLAFRRKLHVNAYLISVFFIYSGICLMVVHSMLDIVANISVFAIFSGAIGLFFHFKLNFENQLKIREELLNTVFNNSPDAKLIVDPETLLITNCNETALGVFRKENIEEVIGKDIITFFKDHETGIYWTDVRRKVKTNISFEAQFKKSDEKSFWGNAAIIEMNVSNKTLWLLRITNINDRVKDKKIIESNRKMLRQVVDLVPHPIYLKDHKARLLYINKAYSELFKLHPEDLLGKRDMDFLPLEEAQGTYQDDMDVIQNGIEKFVEESITDLEGLTHIIQTIKKPFTIDRKKKQGLLGIGIDITERVKDKETIEENRKMLMQIINLLPHPIYLRDMEGKILLANEAYANMHNLSIEEVIGKTVWDLFIPEYAKRFQHIEKDIILKGETKVFPEEISTDINGNIRIMNVIKIPFYLSERKETGILGVNIDITKSKMAEKALKDNEKKFRALIENSSDIIIILNEQHDIKFVGPSIKRILGYEQEYFVGKSVFEFFHEDEQELTSKFLSETKLKPGENHMVKELLIKHFDGNYLFFEIVAVNMIVDPIINGIIINGHDITARKITESELINTNFELDSFVYKASHDLKAPLRSVMGLINLSKIESKDPMIHTYLDMMNKSVTSLDLFIKDLTQFSRNSRLEVESSEVDFDKIIADTLNNLKYMEHANRVTINKNIIIHDRFHSDITRISTVINNLISNAYKYHRIDNNSPYINILINADKGKCRIGIEDNGTGIDASHIGKIFEMFYRASETSYGSGLGLYIVKSAVTKLNGTIEVESELDKGSKFIVEIPNLLLVENDG